MVQEEVRKGPWTEQEDLQLVCFIGLFGDRRWDFIAKVSGLKRTGKSCRLRWVNYLHPGLIRGKMNPHEEKLVLELHSQWGNRWSKIARRLPGRTDNEIKNYWRTHMRKKAQERKRSTSLSTSSSNCCSSSSGTSPVDSKVKSKTAGVSFYDTGGLDALATQKKAQQEEEVCSMDEIWNDITLSSDEPIQPVHDGYHEQSNFPCHAIGSPYWDFCLDRPWEMDEGGITFNSGDDKVPSPLMDTTACL